MRDLREWDCSRVPWDFQSFTFSMSCMSVRRLNISGGSAEHCTSHWVEEVRATNFCRVGVSVAGIQHQSDGVLPEPIADSLAILIDK